MKFDFYPFYKLSLKKGFASFEKKTFHPIQLKIYYSKTREKKFLFFHVTTEFKNLLKRRVCWVLPLHSAPWPRSQSTGR